MIWLTAEQHQEVLEHPVMVAMDAAALQLADRATRRPTHEAIQAAARAAEASYWTMNDLVSEIAEQYSVDEQATPNGNGGHAST